MACLKKICFFLLFIISCLFINQFVTKVNAVESYNIEVTPAPCFDAICPTALVNFYNDYNQAYQKTESCAMTLDEFKADPFSRHYWVKDPEITAQGKADERARQFIYWVVNSSAIDEHPVLKAIWNTTRNVAYFFVILIAAVLGLTLIIGQRANFETKIKVWPAISKIIAALLYISFSAAIVLFLIQFSEILTKFFMESLGGRDLFNIYFSSVSQEKNYIDFLGCRDLNFNVQEGIRAEVFLLKLTNVTYYVMGTMLLLRKILLWFLLFVSPFLAILFPFIFIRNTGWIWIGVFFQWLFYGPLFSLFLGALATIWKTGIPFTFDFSRVANLVGYVYPTGINIVYGGPAQTGSRIIGFIDPDGTRRLNNGNYVDTFVEYIITLIMLWAVTFFPWWLLRIFRDYCCDGIYAMKNILMSMYDQIRGGPSPQPPPTPGPIVTTIGTALKIPKEIPVTEKVRIETIEQVRKTNTEEIKRSLDLRVSKLTDIAHFETNRQTQETVRRNLENLANPTRAETPLERQKFMNIRTELFNRAIKEDQTAKQMLSSISTSKFEQIQRKEEMVKTIPRSVPITHVVSIKVKIPQEKITSVSQNVFNSISTNNSLVNNISQTTQVPTTQVQTILNSYKQSTNQPVSQVAQNIAQQTGLSKEKIVTVIKVIPQVLTANKEVIKEVAEKENINQEEVEKVIQAQVPLIAEPEKNIEKTVSIPATVSIEDYEEVKKMWAQQYEKGEVPISENIKSREQWINQDVVFITNTLNKLLSADDKLRQNGLDDLGYILPIFLINNLKGEELTVYLKAKLEAAKAVSEQIDKEKQIAEKIKHEEEFVEIKKPKVEEKEKVMEMKQEVNPQNNEKNLNN